LFFEIALLVENSIRDENHDQKKHCCYCQSKQVKRSGLSSTKRQRWYCKECYRTFSWRSRKPKHTRRFAAFEQWIVEGYSIRTLKRLYRHSKATLQRSIVYWLEHPPEEKIFSTTSISAIFDGTILKNRRGPYIALDANTHTLIAAVDNIVEGGKELFEFYQHLAAAGLHLHYATIDGNPQQNKYLKKVWPNIIIQRCIVHVQRQGLSWCRLHPKRTDAKHLRILFANLSKIKTKDNAQQFIHRVDQWEKRFGNIIQHTPEHGYVFSDLKRARSMLLKALPNLFHFIDNPMIASSTNALEGYFSRLKEHYRRHRGLSLRHRKNYFLWYFYLVRK
jgi:transposase-like protein